LDLDLEFGEVVGDLIVDDLLLGDLTLLFGDVGFD
jgi:hypothetical protein